MDKEEFEKLSGVNKDLFDLIEKKELKVYLGKESFEHRHEMRDDDPELMSPKGQAIYWMNEGRGETLKELNLEIRKVKALEEIVKSLNAINMNLDALWRK